VESRDLKFECTMGDFTVATLSEIKTAWPRNGFPRGTTGMR